MNVIHSAKRAALKEAFRNAKAGLPDKGHHTPSWLREAIDTMHSLAVQGEFGDEGVAGALRAVELVFTRYVATPQYNVGQQMHETQRELEKVSEELVAARRQLTKLDQIRELLK